MAYIYRWHNYCVLFFIIAILMTLWFIWQFVQEAIFIFGSLSIVLLIFLIKQSCLLNDARLICDNCIFTVSSAIVSKLNNEATIAVNEIVISTFGLLIGNKLYKWGYQGAYDVKLKAIEINREKIYIIFGDGVETLKVELLHGITSEEEVIEIKQKFWRETGLDALVNGW